MLRYRSHYPAAAIASLFLLAFFLSQHGGVNAENDVSLRESEMDGGGGGEFSENNGEYCEGDF